MDVPLTIQEVEKFTVVEFRTPSLMDVQVLDNVAKAIYRLIDEEDRRRIILDFSGVDYVASQALGIILATKKRLEALPHSTFVLCSVGTKVMELLKIVKLDRVLTIKPTQKEAVKVLQA